MKKVLGVLFALLCLPPAIIFADEEKEKEKVKVYVFEAGGCPYCEMQMEYLKGLDSYKKKFVIVDKQLYIDHENWEQGKDYELGVAVVEAFNKAGFKDASYQGTPLVVISDLYAAAAYSEDLEEIIDKAYEEGDKDVVSCIADGGQGCIAVVEKESTGSKGLVIAILGVVALVGGIVYISMSKNKEENINDFDEDEEDYDDEEDIEYEEEKVKPAKVAKTPTKKSTNTKKSTTTKKSTQSRKTNTSKTRKK